MKLPEQGLTLLERYDFSALNKRNKTVRRKAVPYDMACDAVQ